MLALVTLADIRLAQRQTSAALALAEQVMDTYQRIGAFYRAGLLRLVYAEALWAAGDPARARAVIAAAGAGLNIRAERIEDPQARQCFLLAVPEHARILALAREWLADEPHESSAR
jgi:hypothetical protein